MTRRKIETPEQAAAKEHDRVVLDLAKWPGMPENTPEGPQAMALCDLAMGYTEREVMARNGLESKMVAHRLKLKFPEALLAMQGYRQQIMAALCRIAAARAVDMGLQAIALMNPEGLSPTQVQALSNVAATLSKTAKDCEEHGEMDCEQRKALTRHAQSAQKALDNVVLPDTSAPSSAGNNADSP